MQTHFNKNLNAITRMISDDEWIKLSPFIEKFKFIKNKVLIENGQKIDYIYFPTTAIISVIHNLKNGTSSEVRIIGDDGLLGVSVLLGDNISFNTARVLHSGEGYRVKAQSIHHELSENKELREILLRYSQLTINQISQNIVCNRHHIIKQKVARHLLQTLDRLKTIKFSLTHQDISETLGVRRESVSEISKKFKNKNLIKYKRGQVEILDRSELEK